MAAQPLTEHQRLVLLAEEYRRRGYQVALYPSKDLLPESLRRFFVGLIAEAGEQIILADVRIRENLTMGGEFDLSAIAEQVEALPNATYELIVIASP
ncbi:MAG: hypothetical protein AAFW75_19855 [Cyanobacteria bacterium J06636_16]